MRKLFARICVVWMLAFPWVILTLFSIIFYLNVRTADVLGWQYACVALLAIGITLAGGTTWNIWDNWGERIWRNL